MSSSDSETSNSQGSFGLCKNLIEKSMQTDVKEMRKKFYDPFCHYNTSIKGKTALMPEHIIKFHCFQIYQR